MILRRIGAVLLGLLVAIVVIEIAEGVVHQLYPAPAGTSMKDMDAVRAYVAAMPVVPLLIVLGGWFVGALLGTWLAARFGRTAVTGYIVGAILLCGGIGSALFIPQQTWFSAASFVGYIVATLIGVRLAAPRPAYPQAPRPA